MSMEAGFDVETTHYCIIILLMPKLSLVSAENVHSTLNEAPAQTRAINVEIELKQGDHK